MISEVTELTSFYPTLNKAFCGSLAESSPVNRDTQEKTPLLSVLKQFVPANKGCIWQDETQSSLCPACNNLPRMWRPWAV